MATKLIKRFREATSFWISPFLLVDHVQGNRFATLSQMRVQLPQSVVSFSRNLYRACRREIALREFLTRQFDQAAHQFCSRRGTGNDGRARYYPLVSSQWNRLARNRVYLRNYIVSAIYLYPETQFLWLKLTPMDNTLVPT
ncbi:MAG TPA: ABC-ATPase domain-containing protein [Coleofasciculaceae cyanobacterium]